MNGKALITLIITIVSVGVALGILIVMLHQTTNAAIYEVQQDIRGMDTRLNQVEVSVAVLLERTAPLAPVAAKPHK